MGGCSNSISLIAGAVVHSSDVGGESVCEVRGGEGQRCKYTGGIQPMSELFKPVGSHRWPDAV